MKTVEFEKEGILYYFHKFIWKEDPEDTCTYKRELIFTLIVTLLTPYVALIKAILLMIPGFRNDRDYDGFKFYCALAVVLMLSAVAGHGIIENEVLFFNDFIHWRELTIIELGIIIIIPILIGLFIIVGAVAIIAGLAYSCFWIYENFIEYKTFKYSPIRYIKTVINRDPETQAGVMYASLKEKWCKKIDWKQSK